MMDRLAWELLEACNEAVVRQNEMLPALAEAIGVPPRQVFYAWALRRCPQRGRLADESWVFFFHGLECDLTNLEDGRLLRLDFGPGGTTLTFTLWGIRQFILHARAPWREFPELRQLVASDPAAVSRLWDEVCDHGLLEVAAPSLVQRLRDSTTQGADGLAHVLFPPGMSAEEEIDCSVAHRMQLSPLARQMLARAKQEQEMVT
jgi:hypothetical protein